MPKYLITCRGGLLSGKTQHPAGSILEMSEAEALSLPLGTVQAAKAEAPPPTPTPAVLVTPKASKKEKP